MSTDSSRRPGSSGPIVIDGISYIPSSVLLTGIPKVRFKDNRAFSVLDAEGQSPRVYAPNSELGFYYNDTRYLTVWETTYNGMAAVPLANELRFGGNTAVFSMTNRDFPGIGGTGRIPRDTFLIRRIVTLSEDVAFETVEIKNFANAPYELQVEVWAGGRFDDLFEVRGFPREKRGRVLPPQDFSEGNERVTVFQYEGLDGIVRKTCIRRLFSTEKIRVSPSLAGHFTRVVVPPKETVLLKSIISFDRLADMKFHGIDYGVLSIADKMSVLQKASQTSPFAKLLIQTDNAIVNRAIQSAQMDLFMLLTRENSAGVYPYAGVPWYSAPFGRDGLIAAYQLLPWYPDLARGVLEYVFHHQGTVVDSFTDQEPGKIFHELRRGEMAKTREVPFIPYYGSVDATPLALILLYEYFRWTMDLESVRRWWPAAMRALEWIDRWGDSDGDGFVEYAKHSATGLVNQGWKDSYDSVMHADGRLALAPIRLCEVQAYVFRARMGLTVLARTLGHEELSSRLRLEALQLKARFAEKFWDGQGNYVYLAIDGEGKPCAVRSSNMGQCLWGQILSAEQAAFVSQHLLSDALFSGYGIRTLASTEAAYNPLSYHNGSVWPHDNSLIMEGLRYYGRNEELERLALALIGVLESSEDFRLPELYCGFRRRGNEPPVPYEVACKPQAWAAGAVYLMLKTLLGISVEPDQSYVVFNSPLLTPKINTLEIRGLRGRDWEMDVLLHRSPSAGTSVEVTRKHGNVRVLRVK